ncbi:hypothetical protein M6B22_07200 [Jatrophihabitans cynanchi]|uniref:Nuclear transport factor 2 family protein n=1 Tax=Jatrophihabitans cynanchi TaxID=2944128 RepID=A0ABY7K3Q6_9ACTN|nr:hypothetical protein [Jatrophihabitans sp. SB3-54]WAX58543.1 hypothetical protein M6B22_07200 [Jatrophihabitans sp. SB3-54]
MLTRRRSSLAATLTTIAGLIAACSSASEDPDRSAPASTTASAARSEAPSAGVIPTESPRVSTRARRSTPTGSSAPDQPASGLTTARVPDATPATRDPLTTARAWAIAANSSRYLDPEPGSWTLRSAPFVTGQEQAAEQTQRHGGGGATWAQIQADQCVTGLRHLTASIPTTLPSGPARRIVYVAGLTALTCATGQVQLSQFAAQVTVTRVHGRWLVAAVEH